MDNIKIMSKVSAAPADWGTGEELETNIQKYQQPEQVEEFDDENYEKATEDGKKVYRHKASGALYNEYGQKLGGRRRRKSSRRKSKRVKSYRMKGGKRKRSRRRR